MSTMLIYENKSLTIMNYDTNGTPYSSRCKINAPVNMKPHHPPPRRPGERPGDLKAPSSNTSMQGPKSVKSPYFQGSQVKKFTTAPRSRSLLTCLVPVQFWSRPYGVMSNALPWGRCFSSIPLSNPLICPGGG